MRWVIGIVVVAVLAILGYQYLGPGGEQIAEQAEQPAEEVATAAEEATEEAAEAIGEAAEAAGEMVEEAGQAAEQAAGEATEEMAEAGEELAQSSAALVVGDIDLGKELSGVVERASDALSGITDVATAEAALPALTEVRAKLEDLAPTVEQLPENAKATLASAVGGMLPELRTLVDQANGIEGVGDVVKPAVEPIMAKLDAWAKQPA